MWARSNEEDLETLLQFGSYMGAFWQPKLLGRLAEAGALPEDLRLKAVAKISNQAIEDFDSDWLETPTTSLFTQEERDALVERVEAETLAALDDEIYRSTEGYEDEVSPSDRYSRARQTVEAYMNLFAEDGSKYAELEAARDAIDRSIEQGDWAHDYDTDRESLSSRLDDPPPASGRNPFDDVDAGHR